MYTYIYIIYIHIYIYIYIYIHIYIPYRQAVFPASCVAGVPFLVAPRALRSIFAWPACVYVCCYKAYMCVLSLALYMCSYLFMRLHFFS